jgi:hypothetical protein
MKGVYCQYPIGCSRKNEPFSRPADLKRHYMNVHADRSERDKFACDYRFCARRGEPFSRKDHYRDHLKDYHYEAIGTVYGAKRLAPAELEVAMEEWMASRKISKNWWRCPKCLVRRKVATSQYTCDDCSLKCEPHVVAAIEAARRVKSDSSP